MLSVAVLGPVEVHRAGERIAVPSGKSTEVLVRLALDAGRVVRTDRLIEDLWTDASTTARNTLQSKVSQLRRALGPDGAIVSGNGGYTLSIDAGLVDALRVVELAAAATAARRVGDASIALARSSEALELFRGDVLIDAGDGEWLVAHRARLEEVRLGLIEDQLAARVELGAGAEVIAELEGLVDEHPLREGLWASLITALYRAGRQADALAAYGRVRDVLVEQLGIEPGPALRELEIQVLQQQPSLGVDPVRSAPTRAFGNLPALTSPLVGRGAEIESVVALLGDRRLVTVVGPAGVGKTRLAIEVGRRIQASEGVWLVRLDAADPSSSLAQVVAEALQVPGGEAMLVDRLAAADALIVLDNCEHVVDDAAALVGRLIDAAPRLRVLATSQLPLDLDGESVIALEPLTLADSTALFAGRAAEIRSQFVLDDEVAAVVEEVCRSLDGLPLAIELAAARVKSLSVSDIARRLDDRFALLQDPRSRRPERRRALEAAISWSYELLFPDDQRGLWALSCFAGSASLAGAEHVLGALGVPDASVVDVVGRLVDRSLVSVEIADDGGARYRLLDSIRAFALDRLREAELADAGLAAHAAWFAGEAERCAATVRGPAQPACLEVARDERANVDAALVWSAANDPGLGVLIANGFGWTWVVLGDGVAGAARVRGALTAAGAPVAPVDRIEGLLLAGWLEASAGDVEAAEADLDEARVLAGQLPPGDAERDRLVADSERHFAFLRIQQGRPEDVVELADSSAATYERLGLAWERASSLLLGAFGSIMLGDTAAAARSANAAVDLIGPIGDSWGLVHAEAMLGAIAQADHRFGDAAGSLARAAESSERLGFAGQTALHLTTLGRVQQQSGDDGAAVETLRRAIAAAEVGGDQRIAATARIHLARALRVGGDLDEARQLLERTDRWYRDSGGGDGALLARALLANLSSDGGEDLEALVDEARQAGDHETEVVALDALARLASGRGDIETAVELLAAADAAATRAPHVVDGDRLDAHAARHVVADHPAAGDARQ